MEESVKLNICIHAHKIIRNLQRYDFFSRSFDHEKYTVLELTENNHKANFYEVPGMVQRR